MKEKEGLDEACVGGQLRGRSIWQARSLPVPNVEATDFPTGLQVGRLVGLDVL